MFGVAEDLDLTGLVDKTLQSISVGAQQLELSFDDDWSVYLQGAWQLETREGQVTESSREALLQTIDELKPLVGGVVEFAAPMPPDRVTLEFGIRGRLTLFDDSDVSESFAIEPIGVVV